MNLEYYIAKRIHFGSEKENRFSKPAIGIAITGIALGIAVMLIAVMIVFGFKNTITDKMVGFGSHINISNFDNNNSYESVPIRHDSALVNLLAQVEGVKSVKRYATKPAILKTRSDFQGIVIKGLSADFDEHYFAGNIQRGKMPDFTGSKRNDSVAISISLANILGLNVGDPLDAYFFQDNIKVRRFKVAAIYETHFTEFDNLFVFADMRHLIRLNDWEDDQISGYEILVDDYRKLDRVAYDVFSLTANRVNKDDATLKTRSIKELYPAIFSWLAVLDTNVWIILVIMIIVAGFNMISGVLILILEKAKLVGIVKSLGMPEWNIRKVFLHLAAFLTGKGLIIGNAVALLFYFLQNHYGFITLDPETYYMSTVPVELNGWHLLLLNAGTLVVIVSLMIIPSLLIKRLSVTRVINFE